MEDRPLARTVGVVLLDDFELLDVTGPLECLGKLPDLFTTRLLGAQVGPVRSAQGPTINVDCAFGEAGRVDIVLVPGGQGTRVLASDAAFLAWLADFAAPASLVVSVCTGAGLLAAAGLLDGYRATSNKRAFSWVTEQGSRVDWVPQARWVADRDRWTSAGVAAGMDMTLALIAHLHGEAVAVDLAQQIEYDWHRDPAWDPFAALHGLVADGPG